MHANILRQWLNQGKTVLLDGGGGSSLSQAGIDIPPPLWSAGALLRPANHPVIQAIHESFIRAGAPLPGRPAHPVIITANTFRTQRTTFKAAGQTEANAKSATQIACHLARQAVANTNSEAHVLVAASMAALEDCYTPNATPSNRILKREHTHQAGLLRKHRDARLIDLVIAETIPTLREAIAILEACAEHQLDVIVSFYAGPTGHLLDGTPFQQVINSVRRYRNLLAIGTNCSSDITITSSLQHIATLNRYGLPLIAYAQGAGLPDPHLNLTWDWPLATPALVRRYSQHAQTWRALNVQIIGGCCGTTPEYIAAVNHVISSS